jgi:chemotaxis protein histidine kinase CheA
MAMKSVGAIILLASATNLMARPVGSYHRFDPAPPEPAVIAAPGRGAAQSGPLTSNPPAYRAYLRRMIREDIAKLGKLSVELVELLDPESNRDLPLASKHANQIAKLSRRTWTNLQYGEATRRHAADALKPTPRSVGAARTDAERMRRLVAEVGETVHYQQRARTLDASAQVRTLEKLEQIETAARRIKIDLQSRR